MSGSCDITEGPKTADEIIIITGVIGILFSLVLLKQVASVLLDVTFGQGDKKQNAACVVMTQRIFSSSPRVASKAAANDETPALVCKAEAVEGTAVPHMASNLSPVA